MPIPLRGKSSIVNNQSLKKDNNNNNLRAYAGPEQIVYEGSRVHLEGISYPSNQKLVWTQVSGPKVNLEYGDKENPSKNPQNPSFTAPLITFDINYNDNHNNNNVKKKPFTKLTFELIAKDQSEASSSLPSRVDVVVKMVQRALVFQGGGSLGAYEAGVFTALCKHLIKKDKSRINRPVFDIIAGSSIGAVNAAIIVGNIKKSIVENKNNKKGANDYNSKKLDMSSIWESATRELNRFWDEISHSTWWLDNYSFDMWWNNWNKITKLTIENYKSFLKENEKAFGWRKKKKMNNNQLPLSPLYFYMPENMSYCFCRSCKEIFFLGLFLVYRSTRGNVC